MIFNSFESACDWIDDNTTPETAGMFIIEQIAFESWKIAPYSLNDYTQSEK